MIRHSLTVLARRPQRADPPERAKRPDVSNPVRELRSPRQLRQGGTESSAQPWPVIGMAAGPRRRSHARRLDPAINQRHYRPRSRS
jgi:hypothetical protein